MVSFSGKIISVPALIISADREMDYNNYDQLLCYKKNIILVLNNQTTKFWVCLKQQVWAHVLDSYYSLKVVVYPSYNDIHDIILVQYLALRPNKII